MLHRERITSFASKEYPAKNCLYASHFFIHWPGLDYWIDLLVTKSFLCPVISFLWCYILLRKTALHYANRFVSWKMKV